MAGADLRAALVASCLRGALPPVDLRAVCFVRAMAAGSGLSWCGERLLGGSTARDHFRPKKDKTKIFAKAHKWKCKNNKTEIIFFRNFDSEASLFLAGA